VTGGFKRLSGEYPTMGQNRLVTLGSFVVALAVLSGLVWAIGSGDVWRALVAANQAVLPAIFLVALGWLSAWGLVLWTVLHAIGRPLSPPRSVVVFSAAVFANNVTPFGQAGGEPITAMLIAAETDSEYETGLAAIASVDTLHFVPSMTCAVLGFVYLVLEAAQLTRDVLVAATGAVVLVGVIVTAVTVGWHHRERVETVVVGLVTPLLAVVGRLLPGRTPPGRTEVEGRVDGFFESVGRVADDRETIATAMAFSALGWVALAASLWLSLYALGYAVPIAATLFVVPVGSIAGITPLPGGLGGLEAVFIALLVPTAGVPASVATAAVLIHRGATYWFPTLVGGGVAATIGAQRHS
jgi:uncharacterized protein (TIRG00374 family)